MNCLSPPYARTMPSKLPLGVRYYGTQKVVIVRNEGLDDESRVETQAQITRTNGLFALKTPIVEGDVVEFIVDRRQGVTRKIALAVNEDRNLIDVTWGRAPALRVAAVRRLGIQGLHPAVVEAASALYTDGHFSQAIFEAFKVLEWRIKAQSGLTTFGRRLMDGAFGGESPLIDLVGSASADALSEQLGLKQIFIGAFQAIRNPSGHEVVDQLDQQDALEHLALVSILFRRLDNAR